MNIQIHTYCPQAASYYVEARKEYEKRLSRYCKLKFISYKNVKQAKKGLLKLQENCSDTGQNQFFLVLSGAKESTLSSPDFAHCIENAGIHGISTLIFLVGFSENENWEDFSTSFFSDIDFELTTLYFSSFSLSPALTGLVLEEQIYRAYRIINKEPYHK
ncbi:MAG: 23S rRNA (pseudouridine(1915)-N(3))-methyltransferase RlmH [Lachnospiraceae bacterium]|nr:23S rRNA (pseudouridine(1915)-N(3))-methyltransferase RlmH [Lachnospiraceae bacterium]